MRKRVFVLMIVFLLFGSNLFAADGDLIVNGNVGIKNLTYVWPITHASGVLMNNGSGTLSWTAASSLPSGTSGQTLRHNGTIWVANSVIYNDGAQVGIGTTTPSAKLTVNGGINIPNTNTFNSNNSSGDNTRIANISAGDVLNIGPNNTNIIRTDIYGGNASAAINVVGTNVGIGDVSPASALTVGNGDPFQVNSSGDLIRVRGVTYTWPTANASGVLTNNGSGTLSWAAVSSLPSGTSGQTLRHNGTNWVANSVLYNNGTNVGIGTSAPGDQLEIYDGSAASNSIRISGNRPMLRWNELDSTNTNFQIDIAAGQLRFQTNNDAFTSGATTVVINQNGNVGIGTTAPAYQLQLSTGNAAKATGSTWIVPSDSRLKTNIQPYTKGLKEILQINPITYQYNGNGGVGHSKVCTGDPCVEQDVVDTELLSKTHVGVIAQDIQAVVPETVTSHKGKINEDDTDETDILDFDSHSLTFILINTVKELSAQIDSLNQQIADLKARVK